MAPPDLPVPGKKLPLVKLAVAGLVLVVGAVLVLRGVDVKAEFDRGMELIRGAGPVVFFSAMTVLPALGVPMLAFTIPAGEAFAGQMGLGGVIAVALVVLAVNLALIYWLARYALRPVLLGLLKRFGYSVPALTPENRLTVTLLVRVTPGPPYAVQGYLLGLAEVPFGLYMLVSWPCMAPWAVGAILLGKAVREGNFAKIAMAIGLLIAAIVAVQVLRKKFSKREAGT
jgi:uncharacterized membrane protein YdjX (TVP38/TMEM64 family)